VGAQRRPGQPLRLLWSDACRTPTTRHSPGLASLLELVVDVQRSHVTRHRTVSWSSRAGCVLPAAHLQGLVSAVAARGGLGDPPFLLRDDTPLELGVPS